MAEPPAYDIPSAAGGDHGLEGFDVELGDRRIGRVAALNRTREGLVLVVDTGDAYRPLPASVVARIESVGRVLRLTDESEGTLGEAPAVEPRVRNADTPQLVRHIPAELLGLVVPGRPRRRRSRLWFAGAPLVVLGGVGLMTGPLLTAAGVGGELRWIWVAVPLVLFALGAGAFWIAMSRDSPRKLTRGEKLADAFTAIFGITPRTRRRG